MAAPRGQTGWRTMLNVGACVELDAYGPSCAFTVEWGGGGGRRHGGSSIPHASPPRFVGVESHAAPSPTSGGGVPRRLGICSSAREVGDERGVGDRHLIDRDCKDLSVRRKSETYRMSASFRLHARSRSNHHPESTATAAAGEDERAPQRLRRHGVTADGVGYKLGVSQRTACVRRGPGDAALNICADTGPAARHVFAGAGTRRNRRSVWGRMA